MIDNIRSMREDFVSWDDDFSSDDSEEDEAVLY
jgi:hypothetical protein